MNKQQAKEAAFEYAIWLSLENRKLEIGIDEEHMNIEVYLRCTNGDISHARHFSFAEPKLGDLAWCWDENRARCLRYYDDGWGYEFNKYELLGVNIADKI